MSEILRKHGELVVVGVIASVIGLLVFFGVRPLYQQLVDGRIEIAQNEIAQEMQLQRVFERTNWQDDLDEIATNKHLLEVFVTEEGIVTIVEGLEDIAAKHAVDVKFAVPLDKTATKADVKDKKDKTKTLEVTVQGKFANVTTFLSLMEQYRYYAQIDNIKLRFVPPKREASRVIGASDKSSQSQPPIPATDVVLTFDATYDISITKPAL